MPENRFQLADVLITDQLRSRASRHPNSAIEKAAFVEIARQMSYGPEAVLQALCKAAFNLCSADSAGISVLRTTAERDGFSWNALGGALASFVGGWAPRDHSPCGVCLALDAAQLFSHPERYFEWLQAPGVPIVEGLVIPLYKANREAYGTIWIMSHDEDRHFDGEDLRVMIALGTHASTALRLQEAFAN
jgi:GAF domain-containing protein